MAAALALGRALRNVLIIDNGQPCNRQTPHSHNFLTQDGKSPNEIASLAKSQVTSYESVAWLDAMVTTVTKTANGFDVQLLSGEYYSARKLVLATGIRDIMPDIPGFTACWGISVLHCPYCHGYEVHNQKTGILANGDTGFELASLISNWTSELTVYTNGQSTLSEHQENKLQTHSINIVETEIERLEHQHGYIQQIVFSDGKKAAVTAMYARLPFVQPATILASLGIEVTIDGYIKVDVAQRTSIPGVYACGDNTTRMRTLANAVSMGTTTGLMVNKELIEEDF
ncbi:NAD(P)/FAD-dependent oxidoreductase [Spirosoma telluris]|uniref:NAD(P)/FAD-dependent oxidoreductase n=1 Tax=Spirosoma telluris TaxID=2183553 RepID=UPI002FC29DD5